ncbi:DUF695 domain-containing protein [Rhodopirellula baltica]|uniref:Protein containing DUF1260 n=1 Tax=Rhodopirellula baltica SWK14 TaxID=993516 RepID=L7CMX8_RHOBT|nr:DUF695 domain-containing protein [Rhodopirellula baltica]ELP35333.1 protein containing DUF1260 [Rhodopirellula baltica SWK14]
MSEQWEFYPSRVDDQSASIYVNLSYRGGAPLVNAHDLAWLRVYFRHPRDDGLSSQEEFQTLCDIEDAIVDALANGNFIAHYVGRNTSGGCRDFYIYSDNGQTVSDVLSQAMVPFTDYQFDTDHRHEPDWSAYRDFLCPSPRDMQLIQNQHVIESLQESNDQLDILRNVSHWAYFTDASARKKFVSESHAIGFALHHEIDPDAKSNKWGAVVTREHAVDYSSLAEVTLALYDIATELGGDYDGWETPVISEANQALPPK